MTKMPFLTTFAAALFLTFGIGGAAYSYETTLDDLLRGDSHLLTEPDLATLNLRYFGVGHDFDAGKVSAVAVDGTDWISLSNSPNESEPIVTVFDFPVEAGRKYRVSAMVAANLEPDGYCDLDAYDFKGWDDTFDTLDDSAQTFQSTPYPHFRYFLFTAPAGRDSVQIRMLGHGGDCFFTYPKVDLIK